MVAGHIWYLIYRINIARKQIQLWEIEWVWFIQARKLLPNGEEAGLGIVPSKQRWPGTLDWFADFAKPILRTVGHSWFCSWWRQTLQKCIFDLFIKLITTYPPRWERKMKMKNRKLVFGGQGGGHGRSSTSLDRWVGAKHKFWGSGHCAFEIGLPNHWLVTR